MQEGRSSAPCITYYDLVVQGSQDAVICYQWRYSHIKIVLILSTRVSLQRDFTVVCLAHTCTDWLSKPKSGNGIGNGVLSAECSDAGQSQVLLICNKLILHQLTLAVAVMWGFEIDACWNRLWPSLHNTVHSSCSWMSSRKVRSDTMHSAMQ